jgi:hypothetical protein
MRWTEHVSHTGKRRGAHRVLVERPEGRRPIGRPMSKWQLIFYYTLNCWDGGM